MLYGKLNWIRHWLIGESPKSVDNNLFSSGSLARYLAFLRLAIRNMRAGLRDDGFVCLVIGDVRNGSKEVRLAERVAQHCLGDTDLRVKGIVVDRLPVEHKVSRIWGETKGRATRTDRILVLAAPKARLPGSLPIVSWD
jgi:site-specific DNA-methyltransferase (adenine-specific)